MNKERQRYLAFRIITEDESVTIPKEAFIQNLWRVTRELWGAVGAAASGFYLMEYDEHYKTGLLRYAHNFRNELESVLACITSIDGKKVLVTSLITCATINRAKRSLEEMDREE